MLILNSKPSVKTLIFFLFIISPLSFAPPAFSQTKKLLELDGYLLSGVSLFEHRDESFGQKLYPSAGAGCYLFFPSDKKLTIGTEFLYQYNFRSNYINLYYYGKYHTLGFQPFIAFYLNNNAPKIWFIVGGGIKYSFSRYIQIFYPFASGGICINLRKKSLEGILLEYSHNFLISARFYETLTLRVLLKLWEKGQ